MRIVKNIEADNRTSELKAAKRIHPEDISVGDDVAVFEWTFQYPSYLWCGADLTMLPADESVRVTFQPFEHVLLKVKSICLPFILCQQIDKDHKVFDLRQVEFVRVDSGFATQVRESLRDSESSGASKKKSKRKRNKKAK